MAKHLKNTPIAKLARDIAQRIRDLPEKMKNHVGTYTLSPLKEVKADLAINELWYDFSNVINFIERNWTPDHAKKWLQRICKLKGDVEAYLLDYAELVKLECKISTNEDEFGTFFVFAREFTKNLNDWANAIEEKELCLSIEGETQAGKRSKKKKKRTRGKSITNREEMAHELKSRKFSQKEIACQMEIGEPRVSQLIKAHKEKTKANRKQDATRSFDLRKACPLHENDIEKEQ